MGVRPSLLYPAERRRGWLLARQSGYDHGVSADDAGGLRAGVPEVGGTCTRDLQRRSNSCPRYGRPYHHSPPNRTPAVTPTCLTRTLGWKKPSVAYPLKTRPMLL